MRHRERLMISMRVFHVYSAARFSISIEGSMIEDLTGDFYRSNHDSNDSPWSATH